VSKRVFICLESDKKVKLVKSNRIKYNVLIKYGKGLNGENEIGRCHLEAAEK